MTDARKDQMEDREIRDLYWDCVCLGGGIDFVNSVDEIARAYGYASGRQMRRHADLAHDMGIHCPDCNRILMMHSRHEFREHLARPRRCEECQRKAQRRVLEARIPPATIDINQKEPKPMANVSTVLSGEAAIHTTQGGLSIELRLPQLDDGQEYTPMMKLLAAVAHRADEEIGWWEDQVRWFDAYMARKRFAKTRLQLRLVTDDKERDR